MLLGAELRPWRNEARNQAYYVLGVVLSDSGGPLCRGDQVSRWRAVN
jgi:hypothetical protein